MALLLSVPVTLFEVAILVGILVYVSSSKRAAEKKAGRTRRCSYPLTPSRLAFLFTTVLPFFATRYRTSTRARGS
jgi:hypothetical protein